MNGNVSCTNVVRDHLRLSLTLLYCGIDVCTQFTELLLPLEEKMAKQLHSQQDLSSECPRSDKLDTNWFPNYIHDVIVYKGRDQAVMHHFTGYSSLALVIVDVSH